MLHRFGLERDRFRAVLCQWAGISASELDALEHLERDGPLTQRELGERLLLTSGGVTVLVDRLERAGWVARTPHPKDRRAVLLKLAPRALRDAPPALGHFHDAVEAAARAIPARDRRAVASFLATVTRQAAEAADTLAPARARPVPDAATRPRSA